MEFKGTWNIEQGKWRPILKKWASMTMTSQQRANGPVSSLSAAGTIPARVWE